MLCNSLVTAGWMVYGCSQYPTCNGNRSKDDKRPGPVVAITRVHNLYGNNTWEEMGKNGIAGQAPFATAYDPK